MIRNHNKFVVLKVDDIMMSLNNEEIEQLQHLIKRVGDFRDAMRKPSKNYVVVADNWPMYEQTWKAIEEWVDG